MPYQTPCPKCLSIGFVRLEHVITGGRYSKAYYCGRCDHEWNVADPPTASDAPTSVKTPPPFPKPRTRRFGPNR